MKLVMDYAQRPLCTSVIAKLHGTEDNEWVLLGNHHDAWAFGAADPGSGTAAMLEAARALGELREVRMEAAAHDRDLRMGRRRAGASEVRRRWWRTAPSCRQRPSPTSIRTWRWPGPEFSSSATPSLKELVRDATRQVPNAATGLRCYRCVARTLSPRANGDISGTARQAPVAEHLRRGATPDELGSGSDYSAFFDNAGIPSIDMAFGGDYGVYHSVYDDFYWMKRFRRSHICLSRCARARSWELRALRLDEADILPFDYPSYASEIERAVENRASRVKGGMDQEPLKAVLGAAGLDVGFARIARPAIDFWHAA